MPRKMDTTRVETALNGKIPTSTLTRDEKRLWLDRFGELMDQPGPEEEAFWERRRQQGMGVGLDEKGNLVRALPGGRTEIIWTRDDLAERNERRAE